MSLSNKKVKLSKEELEKLAEAVKDLELKDKDNQKTEKPEVIEENKFLEKNIKLEKISPVLKPIAEAPVLENIASSFQLKKETEKPEVIEENKFLEKNIKLEKISPVLKPIAEAPVLENIASSFQLKKETE